MLCRAMQDMAKLYNHAKWTVKVAIRSIEHGIRSIAQMDPDQLSTRQVLTVKVAIRSIERDPPPMASAV